jgi:hypothetical protein
MGQPHEIYRAKVLQEPGKKDCPLVIHLDMFIETKHHPSVNTWQELISNLLATFQKLLALFVSTLSMILCHLQDIRQWF